MQADTRDHHVKGEVDLGDERRLLMLCVLLFKYNRRAPLLLVHCSAVMTLMMKLIMMIMRRCEDERSTGEPVLVMKLLAWWTINQ